LGLRRVKPGGKRTNHTKSGKKAHKSRHRGTRTVHRPAAGSAPATRPDVGSPPPQEEGGGALAVPCSRVLGSVPPDTYTNQWFSDIELSVDAEVVKASSLLQDYCLLVARVCPHLAAYLLASLVECTERS